MIFRSNKPRSCFPFSFGIRFFFLLVKADVLTSGQSFGARMENRKKNPVAPLHSAFTNAVKWIFMQNKLTQRTRRVAEGSKFWKSRSYMQMCTSELRAVVMVFWRHQQHHHANFMHPSATAKQLNGHAPTQHTAHTPFDTVHFFYDCSL